MYHPCSGRLPRPDPFAPDVIPISGAGGRISDPNKGPQPTDLSIGALAAYVARIAVEVAEDPEEPTTSCGAHDHDTRDEGTTGERKSDGRSSKPETAARVRILEECTQKTNTSSSNKNAGRGVCRITERGAKLGLCIGGHRRGK